MLAMPLHSDAVPLRQARLAAATWAPSHASPAGGGDVVGPPCCEWRCFGWPHQGPDDLLILRASAWPDLLPGKLSAVILRAKGLPHTRALKRPSALKRRCPGCPHQAVGALVPALILGLLPKRRTPHQAAFGLPGIAAEPILRAKGLPPKALASLRPRALPAALAAELTDHAPHLPPAFSRLPVPILRASGSPTFFSPLMRRCFGWPHQGFDGVLILRASASPPAAFILCVCPGGVGARVSR